MKNKISILEVSSDNRNKDEAQTAEYFSYNQCKDSKKKMKFYTGLTFLQFLALWNFLGDAARKLSYWNRDVQNPEKSPKKKSGPNRKMDPMNELFLTLVRLRVGLTMQDLAYRFGISQTMVSTIVITWVQFLYKKFYAIRDQVFPPQSVMSKLKPKCFRKMKNLRVIIDCTEIFVQESGDFAKQGNNYSHYKSHTTVKVLVGIAPNGAVVFVSDAFEGSISDKEIVKKSGFLDMIEAQDLVLADRGFLIADLLRKKQAHLNIPPFLGNRDKFTPVEEAKTKEIAILRIHVERAIERMKKYRIIKHTVPSSLTPMVSQMVYVVGMLVNLQQPLVK